MEYDGPAYIREELKDRLVRRNGNADATTGQDDETFCVAIPRLPEPDQHSILRYVRRQ